MPQLLVDQRQQLVCGADESPDSICERMRVTSVMMTSIPVQKAPIHEKYGSSRTSSADWKGIQPRYHGQVGRVADRLFPGLRTHKLGSAARLVWIGWRERGTDCGVTGELQNHIALGFLTGKPDSFVLACPFPSVNLPDALVERLGVKRL